LRNLFETKELCLESKTLNYN